MPVTLPQRRIAFAAARQASISPTLEWLVTNGLGGYASGLVCGGVTRRYHGLLISAMPAPVGRLMCVAALRTRVIYGDRAITIDHEDLATLAEVDAGSLRSFTLDGGLPVWRYEIDGLVLEKRVFMPFRHNATCVMFRLVTADRPTYLECQPWLQLRPHESAVSLAEPPDSGVQIDATRVDISPGSGLPTIRLHAHTEESRFSATEVQQTDVTFAEEQARGYEHHGRLWSNCTATLAFDRDGQTAITIGTEPWSSLAYSGPQDLLAKERARRSAILAVAGEPHNALIAELTLAADQFLIVPVGHDASSGSPESPAPPGPASRTIIAGYHWFTDWGRDTMISLEGLTLEIGRTEDAAQILRLFARHVQDGLIPNLFPEGARSGLYHTADATLWFVHAISRYVARSGDREIVTDLLPVLISIVEAHRAGTRFGIGVDPADGLLRQGADGYQLTWMDAKVDGWVVTPRRGKAVEINALWYNALRLIADWLGERGRDQEADVYRADAVRARESFNRRFWNADTGWLFDVVDGESGDDSACRPNQLFAISLPHPVLAPAHWAPVVAVVRDRLLTPFGLRTLAPDHPDYQSQYTGNLRRRDASYHQGTVWAWLIGAYVDASLKLPGANPDEIRSLLRDFEGHLGAAGAGSISEIFDAETPHLPRGCIAQAWSVAEVLRSWKRLDRL